MVITREKMMNRRRTPKVFFSSYRPKKPQLENKSQFKQIFVVILIVVGGYFFTRLPVFQIKNIDITNIKSVEVISELNELKGQSILSAGIANKVREIQKTHIQLINLNCDKGIPNTLRCQADEREPIFIWKSGDKSFLIDYDGIAYKTVGDVEGVIMVEDRANIDINLGDLVMSEEIVSIYKDIITYLEEFGFVVDNLYVKISPLHPGVIVSARKDNKPFTPNKIEVEFSASYPINTQVKLLSQLIETKAGLIKERVDLRTPGYIYYK